MRRVGRPPAQREYVGNIKCKIGFARPVTDKCLIQLAVVCQHILFPIGIQYFGPQTKTALVKKPAVPQRGVGKKVFPQKVIPAQRGNAVAPVGAQFIYICYIALGIVVGLLKFVFEYIPTPVK